MSKEVFKDIPNYEGMYKVSNLGNVKSLNYRRSKKEKILKTNLNTVGYLVVMFSKNNKVKTFQVHQLVAMSFLNHKLCGYNRVINHINFNKLDNRLENLEVITQRENANQKHIKSSSKYTGVSWNKEIKMWRSLIHINGKSKFIGRFNNEYDAHLAYQKELSLIK